MLDDPVEKRKRLNVIADRLVQMAQDGDIQAMREIGDRLDGKPSQSIDVVADITNRAAALSDDALAEIANAGNRDQT